MARNRVASIKRERLNLQHVMDLLGDGEVEEAAAGQAKGEQCVCTCQLRLAVKLAYVSVLVRQHWRHAP